MKFVFFIAATFCLKAAIAGQFSSYDQCLEFHRSNLVDRLEEEKCKGANRAKCQNQYGEDYTKAIENDCRKQFSSTQERKTLPEDGVASDCSSSTQATLTATAESCQSLAEGAGTRCKSQDSQNIIQMAGKKSTDEIKKDGTGTKKACEQNQAFNQEAQTALERFAGTCEPAITEGQGVCNRARTVIQSSKCSEAKKANWEKTITMGFTAISMHSQTLDDARRSVTAAKNAVAESSECAQNSAATAASTPSSTTPTNADPAATETPTSSSKVDPYANTTQTVIPATAAPSTGITEDPAADRSVAAPLPKGGDNLWDLPKSSSAGDPSSPSGMMGGGDLQNAKASGASDSEATKSVAKGKSTDAVGGSPGSGRGGGRTPYGSPRDFSAMGDSSGRTPAAQAADETPDLSKFAPQMNGTRTPCSAINPSGLTGPHCGQFQKIHERYSDLIFPLDPNL